jgi:hypothetical protein
VYRDSAQKFQVRVPPAPWASRPLDGAAVSVELPDRHTGMALLADCQSPEPGELPWVARHLFFGLQERRLQDRQAVRLHDTPGVRTRVSATLDGQPVLVEGLTLRRAGCLYDFIYVAPPDVFPHRRDDFEAFVDSWAPLVGP